jgi:AraC family transcriptional regulator of adaptative response/methylated-DNA-[protein]-cysteine methyltransferase
MATVLTHSASDTNEFYEALVRRDRSFDGRFYYSVVTTGVFCKPSCSSRRPRRENVNFHPSVEHALAAGYRPCKRCRPSSGSPAAERTRAVERICRLIDASNQPPSIQELASALNISVSRIQRVFKEVTGITPMQYAAERRRQRLHDALQSSPSITEAIYSSGYGSGARFYGSTASALGMKPRTYRSGGQGEAIRFAIAESSLGPILVAGTDRGICSISLGDDPQALLDELQERFPRARLLGPERDFGGFVALVVGLVETPRADPNLPLDIRGTAFQRRVWAALMKIPLGETATYSQIAQQLGVPQAARAVAGACAANPLAVAVPCHRVVRRDGGLSGYRWGVERKRALLERESKHR